MATVLLSGDTHGDFGSIDALFTLAHAHDCVAIVSVGDLWWRPASARHTDVERALRDGGERTGIGLWFIDGNNDDTGSLDAHSHEALVLGPHLTYLPRGCVLQLANRTVLGLGGAPTFRREGKILGVELFDTEELTDDDVARASVGTPVDILVSHDAPLKATLPMATRPGGEANRGRIDAVICARRPQLVVHGHYHRFYRASFDGVSVVGLGRDRGGWPSAALLDLDSLEVSDELAP